MVSNILAHAATVRCPPGSNTSLTVVRCIAAVLSPISIGRSPFDAIARWWQRLQFNVKQEQGLKAKITAAFELGGSGTNMLENAIVAGAVVIYIPPRYRRWVQGYWVRINNDQRMVRSESPTDVLLTHTQSDFNEMDDEYFCLPATTLFKSTETCWFPSLSSFLPQIIAILQLVLSSRQLYLNYNTSIQDYGLASPYLAVVPFLFMTFINFIANGLVGS
jgi:hypothetical protein